MKKLSQFNNGKVGLVIFCFCVVFWGSYSLSFANGYLAEELIPFFVKGKEFHVKIVKYEAEHWGKEGRDVFITDCTYYGCDLIVWTLSEALTGNMGPIDSHFEVQMISSETFNITEFGKKGKIIHSIVFDGKKAKILPQVSSASSSGKRQHDSKERIESKSVELQLVNILADEATKNKIKIAVLDFRVTTLGEKTQSKYKTAADLENLTFSTNEELMADLIRIRNEKGLKDKISFYERNRLNEILQEKKLEASGLTIQQASTIGSLAGVDFIILGSVNISDKEDIYVARVIRVKDAESVGSAKEVVTRQDED